MYKPLEDRNTKSLTTKIGVGLEERAAIRCLESVHSSRTTSLTFANSVRRLAIRAGAHVNGNNLSPGVAGCKL